MLSMQHVEQSKEMTGEENVMLVPVIGLIENDMLTCRQN